jgi:hypothetical protein
MDLEIIHQYASQLPGGSRARCRPGAGNQQRAGVSAICRLVTRRPACRAIAGAAQLWSQPFCRNGIRRAITIDEHGTQLNRLAFGNYGLAELMKFRIICQPSVFMRRTVLEQAGALDTSYHYLLDHHLWLRMAQRAPFQHIADTWSAARHHAGAKNVNQAAGFGREAFRILEWMGGQPDLSPSVAQNRRRIEAGAYRLNARYLLDGGQPAQALRSYWQAMLRNPRFTLQHWRRIHGLASSTTAH